MSKASTSACSGRESADSPSYNSSVSGGWLTPLMRVVDLMTRPARVYFFVTALCFGLFAGCAAPICVIKATPPKPEALAGVWIGFDSDELEFTRLDLRPDFTGYCARVSPADTTLHEYGVDGYRVTRWTIEGWRFIISLTPAATNAEPIYLRGHCYLTSLDLEVGGVNGQWKRKMVLYRESRIDGTNQETRDKIRELEKP
jgi:hypothetical protein